MDVKEEGLLGEALGEHWYYVSKGRALLHYLGRIRTDEVLDVGAGSGIFSRQLLDAGICERALCVDPYYAREYAEQHHGKPIVFARNVPSVTQPLILMMDVLEHVDDDVALLKRYTSSMPVGGQVLITVPAFQCLWSGHDVFLEHRRRYTAKMLQKTVRAAGLEVVRINYFFAFLFPAAAMVRLVKNLLLKAGALTARSELKSAPAWLNRLLVTLHEVERRTVFAVNNLCGLTLFCLCRKPSADGS